MDLEIPYDGSVYKPIAIVPKEGLPASFGANLSFGGNDIIKVAFLGYENINIDGLLFTVTYQINEGAFGDKLLNVDPIRVTINPDGDIFEDISLDICPGTLVIGSPGDIDGDGKITAEDAILLLQMYISLVEWTPRALAFGDINKDGVIDLIDSSLILRIVTGG